MSLNYMPMPPSIPAVIAVILLCAASGADALTPTSPQKIAEGTGFYISHDGYVLTANHVVAHCGGDISAHNEQMVLKLQMIAGNASYDLALLKIIPQLTIEHIAYLRSPRQPLKPGDTIVIAGYPDDTTDLSQEFVAFNTNDAKILHPKGINGEDKWMLFSFSARSGFSGGPVLDYYGNIVGVTSGGTCASDNCRASFLKGIEAVKNATTPEELQAADRAVASYSYTNIAASETAIRKFLTDNGLTMEEQDSIEVPSQARLREIAESIVNIRCTQSDQDFRQSIRVNTLSK